jgi:hypothetical protein
MRRALERGDRLVRATEPDQQKAEVLVRFRERRRLPR